jgi:hypothetical protein
MRFSPNVCAKMPTKLEALNLCDIVRKSEDGFDPFMLCGHCIQGDIRIRWQHIVVDAFVDFLMSLSADEFAHIQQRVDETYGYRSKTPTTRQAL